MDRYIPPYLFDLSLWLSFLPPLILSALVTHALLIFAKEKNRDAFLLIFSMALLGIVAGISTGRSREPAVSAVVPAVLSLISVLMIYIVAAKSRDQQKLTSLVVVAFILNFFVGIHWGADVRSGIDEYANSQEYLERQANILHNVELRTVLHEKQIRDVRKKPELPPLELLDKED